MKILTSILLLLAVVLAVVIGPQTRAWIWGPSLLALGLALLAAIPVLWKQETSAPKAGIVIAGLLTCAWFAWRAWLSPVPDLAMADLLLLAAAAGSCTAARILGDSSRAEAVFIWGIALLLLASVMIVAKQVADPSFIPVFGSRPAKLPSGFFGHYNDGANFLIGASLLLAGAALFGRHATATRVFWGLIAVAGLIAVWFTRSRGGILGASVGAGVFAALALVAGKRANARWFAPGLVAIPILGLIAGGFLLKGLTAAQQLRFGDGLETVMDSSIRLYLYGIAVSCISDHPWAGGGSRSFSWECYRYWNPAEHNYSLNRPELVHNEMLQTATDYGFVGFTLLLGLMGTILVMGFIGLLFPGNTRARVSGDALRAGGIAALAGMLVQSSFSFVFHLLPGAVLLGICLGRVSVSEISAGTGQADRKLSKAGLTILALACVALLLPMGWAGARVSRILWPAYFSKHPDTSMQGRLTALTEAIRIWPQVAFYRDRALVCQLASSEKANTEYFLDQALEDFQQACARHPYDATLTINYANSLSARGRDREAEEQFRRTIELQGGMESAFKGHLSFGTHLVRKGMRQLENSETEAALATFGQSAEQVAQAEVKTGWMVHYGEGMNLKRGIQEGLGAARETSGDFKGAMEAYNLAATLPNGSSAHYRAGVLLGRMAAADWQARMPSKALSGFMEAKQRTAAAAELPANVTPSQRAEYLAYLDQQIRFLQGAKVEPLEKSGN